MMHVVRKCIFYIYEKIYRRLILKAKKLNFSSTTSMLATDVGDKMLVRICGFWWRVEVSILKVTKHADFVTNIFVNKKVTKIPMLASWLYQQHLDILIPYGFFSFGRLGNIYFWKNRYKKSKIKLIDNESFYMSHLIWISRRDRFIKSVNCILNAAVYWRTNQNCLLIIQSESPDLWQVFRNEKRQILYFSDKFL